MATTRSSTRSGEGLRCWRRCPGTLVSVPSSEGVVIECEECGQRLGRRDELDDLAGGTGPLAELATAVLAKTGDAHAP
jgi:hypothetical protein